MLKTSNNYPLVTVIIPSYNHAQYIENAIESIKKQTYKNWELIIIDDGSSDNTHQVLLNLEKDDRIKIILNNDNKRQSRRINEALLISKGKYISLLPSDDWYLPDKLEKQVALFDTLPNDYGVVYSGGLRYFEDLDKMIDIKADLIMRRGSILKNILLEPSFIYPNSPLIKKECFDTYPFDESYTAEGEAIYTKIAMKYKFDFINEALVVMRDHSYNIGANTEVMLNENARYINELVIHKDFPLELQVFKNKLLSELYRMKGLEFIKIHKELEKGKKSLIMSIRYNIKYLFDIKVIVGILISLLPKKIVTKII